MLPKDFIESLEFIIPTPSDSDNLESSLSSGVRL